MTPHILFKFASRSRPEKFFKAIDNIIKMIDDKVNYTVLCTFDKDDVTMSESNICDIAKNYPINIRYMAIQPIKYMPSIEICT